MGKRYQYGECKLCGEYRALTFEHVPPKCVFNNTPVKLVSGTELLKSLGDDALPWDLSNSRSKTQQKGSGGYYLCSDCNSNTGLWYIPAYKNFIQSILTVLSSGEASIDETGIHLRVESIRPLPVFKEIMVMFCDINFNCFGDENLRSYLLTPDSKNLFDSNKYRIFCYFAKGPLLRSNGFSTHIYEFSSSNPTIVSMSEIITKPLGFALYLDMPSSFKPQGFEITGFSKFNYEEVASCEMTLPVLESNIVFSGDYRTKDEIIELTDKVENGR